MGLKQGDVIVYNWSSSENKTEYTIMCTDMEPRMAYFSTNSGLYVGFEIEDSQNITKEEFERSGYRSERWSHIDGSPLFKDDFYSIGDRFIINGYEYILAQVDPKKCLLIGLESGNYWSYAVDVDNTSAITESEMFMITRGEAYTKV